MSLTVKPRFINIDSLSLSLFLSLKTAHTHLTYGILKAPAVNFERGPMIQRTTVCSYIFGKTLVLKEMTRQHEV